MKKGTVLVGGLVVAVATVGGGAFVIFDSASAKNSSDLRPAIQSDLADRQGSYRAVVFSETVHQIAGQPSGEGCAFPLPIVERQPNGDLFVFATNQGEENTLIRNAGLMRPLSIAQSDVDLVHCTEIWTIRQGVDELDSSGTGRSQDFTEPLDGPIPVR